MPEATPIARWPKRNLQIAHDSIVPAMVDTTDTANVIIRPPIAWAVAVLGGLALNWLLPLPFVPATVPAGWLGATVFALALALFTWAIVTITRAGSNVPTNRPTTTIVDRGPYRFTRNPIYLAMVLALILHHCHPGCEWKRHRYSAYGQIFEWPVDDADVGRDGFVDVDWLVKRGTHIAD